MLEFLERYNILTSTKNGFLKEMLTENAIIDFVDFIHDGLTKKLNVGTIFMDLSKILWIKAYLR